MSKKIMVVEDEAEILEIHLESLREQGFEVIGFNNSRAAINYYRKDNSFDLVITDLMMPEKTGEGLIYDLLYINPYQPIAVLSGFPHSLKLRKDSPVKVHLKPMTIVEVVRQYR